MARRIVDAALLLRASGRLVWRRRGAAGINDRPAQRVPPGNDLPLWRRDENLPGAVVPDETLAAVFAGPSQQGKQVRFGHSLFNLVEVLLGHAGGEFVGRRILGLVGLRGVGLVRLRRVRTF